MNITELLEGKRNCDCGMVHLCPIDSVVIEKNACLKLPSLTENYQNILLVADENTYAVCGKAAVAKGIKAGDIIKSVTAMCGGKGGGKPDSAMGGGSDVLKLDNALASVDEFVASKLPQR